MWTDQTPLSSLRLAPRRAWDRQGFIMNVALACILLLGLLLLTYVVYVRGQTRLAQNVLDGEVAFYVAVGGVNAGLGYFSSTSQPSRLLSLLLSTPPDQLNGQHEELPVDCRPIQRLLQSIPGESWVQVVMTLTGFQPFPPPDADSGIQPDPVEKTGFLRVVATAEVQGVRRRVVVIKELKVVNVLPYVISKFTLFASQIRQGQPLNELQWKKTNMISGAAAPGNSHAPLYLRNGLGRNPEENGWVFLGGGPHYLNLTWGETGWGDQFQILKRPWQSVLHVPQSGAMADGYSSLLIQRGFFSGIKADNDLFTRFDFSRPTEDPMGNGCALLRPYGVPAEAGVDPELDLSPTYILGRVYRRFLNLRYVKKTTTGEVVYCPYATPEDWVGQPPSPWSRPPRFDVRQDVFGDNYRYYGSYMSDVVAESYNRSYDYLEETQELDPPMRLLQTNRVAHARGLPDFLYDPAINNGYVVIRTSDQRKLFEGHLHRLVPEDLKIRERAVFTSSASNFSRWLKKRPKAVRGILYFTGGDITIDLPLELETGGIVAADGTITVAAGVRARDSKKPLTLVSLKKDIVIKTSASVEASLVALAGTVTRNSDGPLSVKGNVVAHELDYASLCDSKGVGKIVYDRRLDPTDSSSTVSAYTVQLSPNRTQTTPPAD